MAAIQPENPEPVLISNRTAFTEREWEFLDFVESSLNDRDLFSDDSYDEITTTEVFNCIKNITDPEHPYTLEQLSVVKEDMIAVDTKTKRVYVDFMPTIPHCSQATLIGLLIKVKLIKCLPCDYKIGVRIKRGGHDSEDAINKQLADKERVKAALENPALRLVIENGIKGTDYWIYFGELF